MSLQRQQVARQFSRSADSYDSVSHMQREMADHLLHFLPHDAQGTLIDLGCGTGYALANLAKRDQLNLIGIDIASGMISQAATKLESYRNVTLHVADLESTSLPEQSADFIFSNAALQWCDPQKSIHEIHRLIRPGGRLLFSTFGPQTMKEIRQAWQSIDDHYWPVHRFQSDQLWTMWLKQIEVSIVHIERKLHTSNHETATGLLSRIKRLGATNAQSNRRPGLLSREKFQRFCQALEKLGDIENGMLQIPLTFEQLFFVADVPDCDG